MVINCLQKFAKTFASHQIVHVTAFTLAFKRWLRHAVARESWIVTIRPLIHHSVECIMLYVTMWLAKSWVWRFCVVYADAMALFGVTAWLCASFYDELRRCLIQKHVRVPVYCRCEKRNIAHIAHIYKSELVVSRCGSLELMVTPYYC